MLAKGRVLRHLLHLKQRNVIPYTYECNNVSIVLNRKLSIKNEKCVDETETQGTSECETSNTETDIKQLLEEASVCSDPPPVRPENVWSTSPYPEGVVLKRDQSRHFRKPNKDPKETSIILFPGQGTQYVGMGKDLMKFPIARDLFDAASDLLGYNLRELCFNGPKEELDKTIYCQPAVMVCSLAAVEKLKEERPMAIESCVATAGFSIGEITALVFAGALSFEEGLSYNIFYEHSYKCFSGTEMCASKEGTFHIINMACSKSYFVEEQVPSPKHFMCYLSLITL
jgi:[acyl-carrier-protein] S-malonyltransferase